MSATLERPRAKKPPARSRAQVAEQLLTILTDEPQAEASLRRQLGFENTKGGSSDALRAGLGVLEAQHKAKRIPNTAGSRLGGWVRYESPHEAKIERPQDVAFPYTWAMVPVDEMFIDADYQRPLTTFVEKIVAAFNPLLFQTLALNDRGGSAKKHLAIIDGQTRWRAAERLGIVAVPCVVYKGLTPEEEADIFWQLQQNRKGMVSWHRFRAALKAKRPEALALKKLVESIGYELGDGPGQIKAIAALEAAMKRDDLALERTLANLRSTWPTETPDAPFIRGLHYFLLHYPVGERGTLEVDDERLVRRLRTAGMDGLRRKAIAAKEASPTGKGSAAMFMAQAIQGLYQSGGRSA